MRKPTTCELHYVGGRYGVNAIYPRPRIAFSVIPVRASGLPSPTRRNQTDWELRQSRPTLATWLAWASFAYNVAIQLGLTERRDGIPDIAPILSIVRLPNAQVCWWQADNAPRAAKTNSLIQIPTRRVTREAEDIRGIFPSGVRRNAKTSMP